MAEMTLPLVWWQSDEKRKRKSPELAGRCPEMRKTKLSGILRLEQA
jgi:hypothetical protein